MSAAAAIVLAAGEGRRMKSDLPKVLHVAAERPLVEWVLAAAFYRLLFLPIFAILVLSLIHI